VNTWYICTIHDNAAGIKKDSVYVTLITTPAAPGTISGNTAPCAGATESYAIGTVPGATTYNWTVPAGASILSGQTTSVISVLWGTTPGNVAVTAGNSCGNSTASQLPVIPAPMPAIPGPINGPAAVCSGTSASFSVPAVTGVTNTWIVPPDATITTGQGTNAITVQWGVSAGFVSVTAQIGTCTSSAQSQGVNVEILPSPAQAISGPDTVCQGFSGFQYSIPVISNASSYNWTVPSGAVISQGQGTEAIQVDFGGSAVSGNITAAGINMCGSGTENTAFVTVMVCTGAETKELHSRVSIYPNPAHGLLNVSVKGTEKYLQVRITDVTGKGIYDKSFRNLQDDYDGKIDVSGFAKGVYIVTLSNGLDIYTTKVTID
jgi:hypothetical protein